MGKSPPVKLTFENLEFEVNVLLNKQDAAQKKMKYMRQKIVKGATGYALPGETLYIMGSSGAGKTSLLNILSDRISNKEGRTISGKVMINDTLPLNQLSFGQCGAYVMQDDILYDSFTPREALTFAARLKLKKSIEEQDRRVEELLQELGLLQVADTVTGSLKQKTLSGGERKRTSIGVELITDPSMVLLDEPTSGLDSFKALQIVKLLDRQAKKGKTVIATIHQPSSEAFSIFNRLILMMDGYIVYQGLARESTAHFGRLGMHCPTTSNPADFFMKLLSINYPKLEEDEQRIKVMSDHYIAQCQHTIQSEIGAAKFPELNLQNSEQGRPGAFKQIQLLMWRNRAGMKRNPAHFRVKIGQTIFMGLICLALFHDQYDYSEARSLLSGIFFICINQTMQNMMGTILTFNLERPVFLREQANRMYSVGAYYLAKILIETPVLSFVPMLFSVIVYFKIGLTITASQFFYFYLILLLVSHCAASFGYFISSIFNKEENAIALAPIIMMPIILFGGQFANSGNIQAWISWFQYISPIRYGFECFTRNEFDNRSYNSTAILLDLTTKKTFATGFSELQAASQSGHFNISNYQILKQPEVNPTEVQGFNVGLWQSLLILASLTIALRFLSFVFLKLLVQKFQ